MDVASWRTYLSLDNLDALLPATGNMDNRQSGSRQQAAE
jgi:hypothetical protein